MATESTASRVSIDNELPDAQSWSTLEISDPTPFVRETSLERVDDEVGYGAYHSIAHNSKRIGLLAAGVGVGALLMFLFDPDRGRGRRSRLKEQVGSKLSHLGETAGSKARHLRNRSRGLFHEMVSTVPGHKTTISAEH